MEIIIICIVAFGAAILTFFSGFGLGTILLPVFSLFFSVDLAIALTGIVHFANNLFKISIIGKAADKQVLIKFGIPAILASFIGAALLLYLNELPIIYSYTMNERIFEVTPIKLTIAIILMIFAILELIPFFKNLQFDKNKLFIGGILSGFFGGLSGIQGAIRSAFLIKLGLTKESYIATGVVIACLIDFTRLSVYASRFNNIDLMSNSYLIVSAVLSAIIGAYIGKKLLKKITLNLIQTVVAIMLIIIPIGLGSGLI